jgi:CRP-like cAMP-binding protein
MLTRRRFAKGETILRENDLGEVAYIIEKGRVEITKRVGDRDLHLTTVGPGETLGEMSIVDDKPRSATAIALEPTEVTEVHQDEFYEALQTDPQLAITLLKSLFERLREADARLLRVRAELEGVVVPAAPPSPPLSAPRRAQPVVHLRALTAEAEMALPEGAEVRIDRFPFRIGRASHNPLVHNELELQDEIPWQISRHHLAFVLEDGRVGIVDRGSHLGSRFGDSRLGGHQVEPGPIFLEPGTTQLVLGSVDSQYQFEVRFDPG